jgi:class 3 adenylate cyclase
MDRRGRGGRLAAVLFTDIVRSTETASSLGDRRWREVLSRHHRLIRAELRRHGGHEHDTAGDGFFASFDAPADAIRCAVACAAAVRELGIEIRAGINFGQIEMVDGKPGGIVVHAGARIMGQGEAGQVIVSSAAHDVVPGAGIGFEDLGQRTLKGLDAPVHLFSVASVDGVPLEPPNSAEVAGSRLDAVGVPAATGPRRWLSVAAGVLALAIGAWVVFGGRADVPRARTTGGSPSTAASGVGTGAVPLGSVAEIDPETGAVLQVVPLPLAPQFIDVDHTVAAGLGAVWIVRNQRLVHLDPLHGDLQDPVDLPDQGPSASYSVAVEGGAVWALSEQTLFEVNPGSNKATPVISLGRANGQVPFPAQLAAAAGHLWIGTSDGKLIRVDAASGDDRRVQTSAIDAIAADAGQVWTLDRTSGVITRFDSRTMKPDPPIELTTNARDLILDEDGGLWTLDAASGVLTQVETTRSVRVGTDPAALAVGLGSLWVGGADGNLWKVDPTTGTTTEIPIGSAIVALSVDAERGSVWVDTGSP